MKYIYEERFYPKKFFLLFSLFFSVTAIFLFWYFLNAGLDSLEIFLRLAFLSLVWATSLLLEARFAHILIRISPSSIEVGRARLKFTVPRGNIDSCRLDNTSFTEYLKSGPRFADYRLPHKKGWRCTFAIWTKPRLVLELKPGRTAKPEMKSLLLGRGVNKRPKEKFVEISFPTNNPEKIISILMTFRKSQPRTVPPRSPA